MQYTRRLFATGTSLSWATPSQIQDKNQAISAHDRVTHAAAIEGQPHGRRPQSPLHIVVIVVGAGALSCESGKHILLHPQRPSQKNAFCRQPNQHREPHESGLLQVTRHDGRKIPECCWLCVVAGPGQAPKAVRVAGSLLDSRRVGRCFQCGQQLSGRGELVGEPVTMFVAVLNHLGFEQHFTHRLKHPSRFHAGAHFQVPREQVHHRAVHDPPRPSPTLLRRVRRRPEIPLQRHPAVLVKGSRANQAEIQDQRDLGHCQGALGDVGCQDNAGLVYDGIQGPGLVVRSDQTV
mmetsp:Transcript_82498/g.220468  ORF Transcript_82498/g.220468 Transcript_82498/m.220468 type:complete len:292 (-) Transcript_82498:360-1235(-)